jgi:hypothetical protein
MSFRERRLRHWHPEGKDLFLTWRLHDRSSGSTGTSIEPSTDQLGCGGLKSLKWW